jgi:hypothetical protein
VQAATVTTAANSNPIDDVRMIRLTLVKPIAQASRPRAVDPRATRQGRDLMPGFSHQDRAGRENIPAPNGLPGHQADRDWRADVDR